MAFTNGSLFGIYDGQSTGANAVNSAWSACNLSNPNLQPSSDLFQIFNTSGSCLLQVTGAGVVNINGAASGYTPGALVARMAMSQASWATLPAVPTASQICQAMFPSNFAGTQLDIFQVATQIATSTVAGGGGVIFRFLYNGSTATS